jgi:hypothetical protein
MLRRLSSLLSSLVIVSLLLSAPVTEASGGITVGQAAGAAGSSTLSFTFACPNSNANTIAILTEYDASGQTIGTATFNGTSMTKIFTSDIVDVDTDHANAFYLLSPPSASSTIALTNGASTAIRASVACYYGVRSTSQPDNKNSTFGHSASSVGAQSLTVTTVAANDWVIAGAGNNNNLTETAGSGTTQRVASGVPNQQRMFDTNGTVGASGTINVTYGASGGSWSIVGVAIAPATATRTFQLWPFSLF